MGFILIFICLVVVVLAFQALMRKGLKAEAATKPVGSIKTYSYTGKSGVLSERSSKMGMEQHINMMMTNGWEVVNQTGLPGHVRLGRTLTGAALTGGLSLLAGGSRTADHVTITYRRVRIPAANNVNVPAGVESCTACGGKCTSNSLFCAFCGHNFDGDGGPGQLQLPEAGGSRIEKLERLTALKEKGALNDAEFENEKRRILG